MVVRTSAGFAMPTVSAIPTRARPHSSTARATSASTRAYGRNPSKGHPRAVANPMVTSVPAFRPRAATLPARAIASSVVMLALLREWESEADTTMSIRSTRAATARSAPRSFGTSAVYTTPGARSMRAMISSASRNWGIALGWTNEVAWISRSPVRESALMRRTFTSVGMNACSI